MVNVASGTSYTAPNLGYSGLTLNLVGAGGNENISGLNGGDSISGLAGDDTLVGGAGANTLSGGGDNDTFIYAGTSDAATGETVDGGSGTDTVRLTASTDLTGVTLANIEALSLADGTVATFTDAQITGQAWVVSGTTGGGTETLAVTAASGTNVTLAALTGLTNLAVTLTGVGGAETLTGSAVADTLTGGAGADSLTGGAGADAFVFATGASGITVPTADVIGDFASGVDVLRLGLAGDPTAGTGNYVEAGAAAANFSAALTAANTSLATLNGTSSAARLYAFEFDATNGYLFIDTNSDGVADEVIVLTGIDNTEIAAGDIVV